MKYLTLSLSNQWDKWALKVFVTPKGAAYGFTLTCRSLYVQFGPYSKRPCPYKMWTW